MACLHVVLAVLTAFEVLGFSGLHYGIAAIKLVWRDLGIYGYVCSANGTVFSAQTICNNQEEMYTLAFAIGIVLSAVGCFLYGFLEDKFDTHRVKFIPISFFIGGTMCLAFVAPGYDWLIFPGLSAIAISSLQILTIATKVTYFFPAKKEALSALLNGFFDSSAANFELVSDDIINSLEAEGLYAIQRMREVGTNFDHCRVALVLFKCVSSLEFILTLAHLNDVLEPCKTLCLQPQKEGKF